MKNRLLKLKSSQGASLVIALVFMLFCVFVGGSVLTAATVNAHRVKDLTSKQESLNQESAAAYWADDLRIDGGSRIRVVITDTERTPKTIKIYEDGSIQELETLATERTVKIKVSGSDMLTISQRVLVESAIRQYVAKEGAGLSLSIEGFNCMDPENPGAVLPVMHLGEFWMPEQAVTDLPMRGTFHTQISAPVEMTYDAKFSLDSAYNFKVNFDKVEEVGLGTMIVKMNGSTKTRTSLPVVEIDRNASQKITTKQSVTTLSWSNPRIVKVRE